MKIALITASLLLATSISAQATETPAETAETKAASFTLDTPIAALMADPRAKAVVEQHIPGMEAHPAYDQFKGMSLSAVQPFSGGMITEAMLAAIAAGLAGLT